MCHTQGTLVVGHRNQNFEVPCHECPVSPQIYDIDWRVSRRYRREIYGNSVPESRHRKYEMVPASRDETECGDCLVSDIKLGGVVVVVTRNETTKELSQNITWNSVNSIDG